MFNIISFDICHQLPIFVFCLQKFFYQLNFVLIIEPHIEIDCNINDGLNML